MNTFLLTLAALATAWTTETNEMVVRTDKPGAEIRPTMYGLFFEDINYAADGGLYAEMVKNRSFEFPQRLMGWSTFGNVSVRDGGPFSRNPHYGKGARGWRMRATSGWPSARAKATGSPYGRVSPRDNPQR